MTFCIEKNGLARSISTNQVTKAMLNYSSQNTVAVLLVTNRATKFIPQDLSNICTGQIVKLNGNVIKCYHSTSLQY